MLNLWEKKERRRSTKSWAKKFTSTLGAMMKSSGLAGDEIVGMSNGESAFSYFAREIGEDALYLLDEPENSLSPSNQLELKYFIEDCVRNHGCQFIISTHSPFLLSLKGAKIYDIDSYPVETKKWTELDCVRVYQEFFRENDYKF
mgnify:CR=1 FL=1